MYTILLAEDEVKIREGLKTILEDIIGGFQVVGEAANGKEAQRFLETQVPDVLITDIRMPEMQGLDLIHRIREVYPEIFIIIISGYSDFTYARSAIKYGVSDYLLKPVDRVELTLAMEKIKRELDLRKHQIKHGMTVNKETDNKETEKFIIRKVKEIVIRRLEQDISLQYVAEQVHMNHRYLSVLFKSETGQNFSDYVTELRIEKAKVLLKDTHLNIENVAECCGYLNAKYFMSVFKQSTGKTPTSFRNDE